MKKLLIFLLSALSLTAFAQQKKVAVYVIGEQTGINKYIGAELVEAFARSDKYIAVERTSSFLAELSKEQYYQRSGAVGDNDIARLGVQFGVNFVCVAEVEDVFEEKFITARLIDTETAEVVNSHKISRVMKDANTCKQMAAEIANRLSMGTFAEQAEIEQQRREAESLAKAEAARNAEKQRRQSLTNAGYIDLGLPSGTWWKVNPEISNHCAFSDVRNKNKLPTRKQAEELMQFCTWQRNGHGYIAIGPNGNSISFPSTYSYKDW